MRLQTALDVELDSGETFVAKADQRDYAALEGQDIPEGAMHTRGRFLAWHAAKRAGKYSGTWKAFNETDCVEVSVGEEEIGDQLDPGRVDQNVAA